VEQKSPGVSSKELISGYARLLQCSVATPQVSPISFSTILSPRDEKRPCALLLSPHPDDECLMGGLPLRLLREQDWQVFNIAVTLGSKPARRDERKNELASACAVLGFECVLPEENGLSDVSAAARDKDAEAWNKKVESVRKFITQLRPQAVFMPHADDGHATHVGTHLLGMDALAKMPSDFTCAVGLTEYWQPLAAPNTIIGIEEDAAAALMTALACHAGEVARNAYDRRFPAFLIDAVRRSERIGAFGKASPTMNFAQMLCLGVWKKGRFVPSALNRSAGANESVGFLFE